MDQAIYSKALTRSYGKALVVDNLDLSVGAGTVTAFLGPNGAGKTTTIRMLLGLLKPQQGVCEVLGLPPGDPRALARVGAMVETPSLYDHLTGLENVEITRLMKNAPRSDTGHVLSLVGLATDADRPVRMYSLGMRQRLGVALALIGDPQLLILDEPNNGLDPAGILEMRELIKELVKQHGTTVFLSSHILAEVEQVASHAIVIHRGRLRYQGPMDLMGASGAEEIRVRVGDPSLAASYLISNGFQVRVAGSDVCVQVSKSGTPPLVALLIEGGHDVYELAPLHRNLETRFLGLLETP